MDVWIDLLDGNVAFYTRKFFFYEVHLQGQHRLLQSIHSFKGVLIHSSLFPHLIQHWISLTDMDCLKFHPSFFTNTETFFDFGTDPPAV